MGLFGVWECMECGSVWSIGVFGVWECGNVLNFGVWECFRILGVFGVS